MYSSSLPLCHPSIPFIFKPAINNNGVAINIFLLVQIDYMLTIPMLQETRAAAGTSIKVHVMYMIGLKLCELVHRIYISDAICCITHQVHRPNQLHWWIAPDFKGLPF